MPHELMRDIYYILIVRIYPLSRRSSALTFYPSTRLLPYAAYEDPGIEGIEDGESGDDDSDNVSSIVKRLIKSG